MLTTFRIDSSSIFVLPSERPSNQIAADVSTRFKVKDQVVECWDTYSGNAGNAEL